MSRTSRSTSGAVWVVSWVTPGLAGGTGFKLDLRYDQLNQNQLRHGTRSISAAATSQIVTPDGEMQEVERYTRNHYLTLGLDYSPQPDWGVNLQLPYIVRHHSSLGTASDGSTAGPDGGQYDSKTWSVGDVKLVGRYLGLLPRRNLALSADRLAQVEQLNSAGRSSRYDVLHARVQRRSARVRRRVGRNRAR